jgi:hypothetical protein
LRRTFRLLDSGATRFTSQSDGHPARGMKRKQ